MLTVISLLQETHLGSCHLIEKRDPLPQSVEFMRKGTVVRCDIQEGAMRNCARWCVVVTAAVGVPWSVRVTSFCLAAMLTFTVWSEAWEWQVNKDSEYNTAWHHAYRAQKLWLAFDA